MMPTVMLLLFLFASGLFSTGRLMTGEVQGESAIHAALSALCAFLCACSLLFFNLLT